MIRNSYSKGRTLYHQLKFYWTVNWFATLYFNFKKFPFETAKKLPVFFYGKVKLTSITGQVHIDAPIRRGMIGFGQPYELNTLHKGTAEVNITGTLVFKGHVQFGKDCFIIVRKDAYCELGHLASLGSGGKLICAEKIVLGSYARLGSECQVIDTNFHQMFDTKTGEVYKMTAPIEIGSYNFVSNRVTFMKGAKTPDYCTIASNSVCSKDYTSLSHNTLIGGVPAKLIRENISRDWEAEKELLNKWVII